MANVWRRQCGSVSREHCCEISLLADGACPCLASVLFEVKMYVSQELPVIGGFGVTRAIGSAPGAWKTDFTCLITDVHLATQPLPGCNYGP